MFLPHNNSHKVHSKVGNEESSGLVDEVDRTTAILQKKKTQAKIFKERQGYNYLLLYGCRPSESVLGNTKMIEDISRELLGSVDPETHLIKLPDALENLIGRDAQFEMSKPTNLSPITLRYEHFEITKSIGLIFTSRYVDSMKHLSEEEQNTIMKKYLKNDPDFFKYITEQDDVCTDENFKTEIECDDRDNVFDALCVRMEYDNLDVHREYTERIFKEGLKIELENIVIREDLSKE